MPVAAAGLEQAEPDRNVGEPRAELGRVAGVAGLERVESLALEPLEERARAPLLDVRDRDHPPHRVHQLGDLAEGRERLVDERGPAAANVAVECVGHIDGAALGHDGPRHVRPPHRGAVRLPEHVVEFERDAEPLKPGHHLTPAADAIGAAALEERLQLGRVAMAGSTPARAFRPTARPS